MAGNRGVNLDVSWLGDSTEDGINARWDVDIVKSRCVEKEDEYWLRWGNDKVIKISKRQYEAFMECKLPDSRGPNEFT